MIPQMITNILSGLVAIEYGLKGPNFCVTSACATATHSIGEALRMIQHGEADVILAGGAEAPLCELGVGGFCAMRALSTRNDEPQRASRPFDRDRDGFVIGEGAGVLVLEELEHAKKRGARIYCELAGYGRTCDAYHITAPDERGARRGPRHGLALRDAGAAPEDVDYINAHGTSTALNDKCETMAIKLALGEEQARRVMVSSTKSMTGHLLGAAGAVESVACALAIGNGVVPPTINYETPDPDVRSRLRAEHGPRGPREPVPQQLARVRRPQRHALLQVGLALPGGPPPVRAAPAAPASRPFLRVGPVSPATAPAPFSLRAPPRCTRPRLAPLDRRGDTGSSGKKLHGRAVGRGPAEREERNEALNGRDGGVGGGRDGVGGQRAGAPAAGAGRAGCDHAGDGRAGGQAGGAGRLPGA